MDDLLKRLRAVVVDGIGFGERVNPDGPEAADEIERLRAALGPFAREGRSLEEHQYPEIGGDWECCFATAELRAAVSALANTKPK